MNFNFLPNACVGACQADAPAYPAASSRAYEARDQIAV
jgi:hypothetical protein